MRIKSTVLDDRLHAYLMRVGIRETPAQEALRAETATMRFGGMQIAPEQGAFMQFLVRLTGARRYLEVGVFTGYSSLAVALALPADGRITALDLSAEYTDIARRYWAEAGVADRIDLRLGPALDSLAALERDGAADSFDIAFIDADKSNYDGYYEAALRLVRPGGTILIDNVLWGGAVADPAADDEDTRAIRALNEKLHRDPRIDCSILPISDGLTLARRRS
ncbi:O-methyltransferase [Oceanibacterium hippocampi]|uniref:Putative O-methyltransferase/MSMEI_4947 n=1 Tax=Oceanibacterium hippocampi TaxID=745714 RepID=A0A1Y5R953_9PROT|nr:class I SAM-dependent methyltransferase [Oceanibacterium hippocampi]SLN12054.1 Putative O-methyltransferase/MSMEI_4947 [Oceanibacterium hippocampi]